MPYLKDVSLDQKILKEILDYNPETGVFRWNKRSEKWFDSKRQSDFWNNRWAGKIAGNKQILKSGYVRLRVTIGQSQYKQHRLAWLYMTGDWPKDAIDHIDRDPLNNRWDNLREADRKVNSRNLSRRYNNKSGIAGVHWVKRCNAWHAIGKKNGKGVYLKQFQKEDLDLAAMEVMEFRAENGYEPKHGLDIAPYHLQKEEI